MYPRLVQFGSFAIPTFGLFAAIAVVAALFMARTTAGRLRLDAERLWDLGVTGVIVFLVGSRLTLFLTKWTDFIAHPLWMLGVLTIRSPTALAGGLALAVGAMFAYAVKSRLRLRCTLDALAPALVLGLAIAEIGNFAAGSNFGTPSHLAWAVTYTSRLASLWSRTPLGTPLHPVQIYAALVDLLLFAVLMAMVAHRKRWKVRDGEIIGACLFFHGFASFFLNALRGDLISAAANGVAQGCAICMVLAGGVFWLI